MIPEVLLRRITILAIGEVVGASCSSRSYLVLKRDCKKQGSDSITHF